MVKAVAFPTVAIVAEPLVQKAVHPIAAVTCVLWSHHSDPSNT